MKKTIILLFLCLQMTVSASPEKAYTITADGISGVTAVNCYHGSKEEAVESALSLISSTCDDKNGTIADDSIQVVSSRCGPYSSLFLVCPYVCKARVKAQCQVDE